MIDEKAMKAELMELEWKLQTSRDYKERRACRKRILEIRQYLWQCKGGKDE